MQLAFLNHEVPWMSLKPVLAADPAGVTASALTASPESNKLISLELRRFNACLDYVGINRSWVLHLKIVRGKLTECAIFFSRLVQWSLRALYKLSDWHDSSLSIQSRYRSGLLIIFRKVLVINREKLLLMAMVASN